MAATISDNDLAQARFVTFRYGPHSRIAGAGLGVETSSQDALDANIKALMEQEDEPTHSALVVLRNIVGGRFDVCGSGGRTRTADLRIMIPLL